MDLFDAARTGDLAAVQAFLGNGVDVNARDKADNATALHWAAAAGTLDVVRALTDAGGDVHGHDDDHGLWVIGWATCWAPHADVAEFLVERGARHHLFSAVALGLGDELRRIVAEEPGALNRRMSRNEDYQLPLHFAVRNERADMVALLIELGADPLGIDGSGHLAADYATAVDVDRAVMEAIRALTERELASARRGEREPDLRFHDRLAALALHEFELADVIPGALHTMAKRGDLAAVEWLVEHGAAVDATWTHWGADVTALHLAAAHGHAEVVRALLDAGADPAIRDSMHDSDALGWATFFKQPAAIAVLRREAPDEPINVVLEFDEHDPHVPELVEAFEDGWVVGITSRGGLVRLELATPGTSWGAAVTLVETRLDRLPFDWRSHACCKRP
jgi:ankyrin repeat protein